MFQIHFKKAYEDKMKIKKPFNDKNETQALYLKAIKNLNIYLNLKKKPLTTLQKLENQIKPEEFLFA